MDPDPTELMSLAEEKEIPQLVPFPLKSQGKKLCEDPEGAAACQEKHFLQKPTLILLALLTSKL